MKAMAVILFYLFSSVILGSESSKVEKTNFVVKDRVKCRTELGVVNELRANGMINVAFYAQLEANGQHNSEYKNKRRFTMVNECEPLNITTSPEQKVDGFSAGDEVLCDGSLIGKIESLYWNQKSASIVIDKILLEEGNFLSMSNMRYYKPLDQCILFKEVPVIPYDFEPGAGKTISGLGVFDGARNRNPFGGQFREEAQSNVSLLNQ